MRITNNLLINNMLWNMNNNLVKMNEQQTQLSTGKRIHKPSDDPVGATRVIKVKADIAENAQYKENVRDADAWLTTSENSLMDVKDILQRVRELAVQGANGTYTAEETDKIASEIDQLLEEIIVNANSTMAGRYIFSGYNTDEPLLNEDGTFNVNITSEKMNEFKSIAYEVAVGEELQVGVNYLDVFGAVDVDNTVSNTFVFGDKSAGESTYGEGEGSASTHTRVQGPVKFDEDISTKTLTVTVGGATYTVDTATLDGTHTQEEYVEALLNAEETASTAFPKPQLKDVAEVFFVNSKNPNNKDGELVIEAKSFDATSISIGGSADGYEDNPRVIEAGSNTEPGVVAEFSALFNYKKNYGNPPELLYFKVGGENYYVSTGSLDGDITDVEFLELIKNAERAVGGKLSDAANVTFTPNGGLAGVGTLQIVAKEKKTETITYHDAGGGLGNPGTIAGDFTPASLTGTFDKGKDLSTGQTLSFTYDGVTYTVPPAQMAILNGTTGVTDAQVIAAVEAAENGGTTLGSFTSVTYDGTTLTITADTAEKNKTFAHTDTGGAFTGSVTKTTGKEPIVPTFEGVFDLPSPAGQSITFQFDGQTYTVDHATAVNVGNFEARVRAAVNIHGDPLDDVATITFDAGTGALSIVADDPTSSEFQVTVSGTQLADSTTTVAGIAYKEAVKASSEYFFDISKDISTQPLVFTVGGETFTLPSPPTHALDGTKTQSEFMNIVKGLTGSLGNTLSDVADLSFIAHGDGSSIGSLMIENKTPGAFALSIGGAAATTLSVDYPVTSGHDKSKLEGTIDYSAYAPGDTLEFKVDDATYSVTIPVGGFPDQATFEAALAAADDGSGNLLGTAMDITFTLSGGTTGQLVLEEKVASDAVLDVNDSVNGMTDVKIEDGNTDVVLTGIEKITDSMIMSKRGEGIQSFVVSYNDTSKRIDVNLSGLSTMAEFETAVNAELKDAFGLNDDVPAGNNVSFKIHDDGTKNVVQFIGDGKEDGSKTYLKVDAIVSEKPQLIQDLEDFSEALSEQDTKGISSFLGKVDVHLDKIIKSIADIGAKTNRIDFIENRIDDNNLAMTEILSKVQDIDFSEVTLRFKSLESIYRASLSVGAKVIQPTLIDFMS